MPGVPDPNCPVCRGTGKVVRKTTPGTLSAGVILGDCPVCVIGELTVSNVQEDRIAELERQLEELRGGGDGPQKSPPSVAMATAGKVGKAFVEAGKSRIAAEANRKLVSIVRDVAGDRLPPGPVVDAVLSVTVPVALIYATGVLGQLGANKHLPGGLLPKVNAIAEYALLGTSQDAVEVALIHGMPVLKQLGELGTSILSEAAELEGQSQQQVLPSGGGKE